MGTNHYDRRHLYPDDVLVECYLKHHSLVKAAKELGVSHETVARAARRAGILPQLKTGGAKRKAEHAISKECAYCGKKFVSYDYRKIYCSKRCKDIVSRIKRGIKCNPNTEPYHKICVVCGKPFDSYKERRVTCSKECADIHNGPKTDGRPKSNIAEVVNKRFPDSFDFVSCENGRVKLKCKTCGEIIERSKSTITRYNTRCENCKEIQNTRRELVRVLSEVKKIRTPRTCAECGETFFSKYDGQKYCSEKCKRKHRKIGATYRRRCRHYGVYYDPSVTREKVIERDGNVCQICGEPCDENDRSWGTIGPKFPTLDHIIPLAKGGAHTWDNVQCAHAICNSYKRDLTERTIDEKCS